MDFSQRFTEAEVITKVQLIDKRQGYNSQTTTDEQKKETTACLTVINHTMQ